ncbi:MAG: hypothetical protein FD138_4053, partial [Planctomycetota bacterium]
RRRQPGDESRRPVPSHGTSRLHGGRHSGVAASVCDAAMLRRRPPTSPAAGVAGQKSATWFVAQHRRPMVSGGRRLTVVGTTLAIGLSSTHKSSRRPFVRTDFARSLADDRGLQFRQRCDRGWASAPDSSDALMTRESFVAEMCGDDDTHPLGGRWCGDGSIVAPRRDGLAGWPTVGGNPRRPSAVALRPRTRTKEPRVGSRLSLPSLPYLFSAHLLRQCVSRATVNGFG